MSKRACALLPMVLCVLFMLSGCNPSNEGSSIPAFTKEITAATTSAWPGEAAPDTFKTPLPAPSEEAPGKTSPTQRAENTLDAQETSIPTPTGDIQLKISPNWRKGRIPEYTSDKWNTANWSPYTGLYIENDTLVMKAEGWSSPCDELPAENGTFCGHDHGEWGGGVSFKPDVGSEYILFDINFRGFYTIGDQIYALAGLSHMFDRGGSIYAFSKIDDKWKAEVVRDIKSCPETYLLVDDTLYIATNQSLIAVRDNEIIDTLVTDVFWSGLYPTCMLYANSSIFLSMRGGVYQFDLNTRAATWYDFVEE